MRELLTSRAAGRKLRGRENGLRAQTYCPLAIRPTPLSGIRPLWLTVPPRKYSSTSRFSLASALASILHTAKGISPLCFRRKSHRMRIASAVACTSKGVAGRCMPRQTAKRVPASRLIRSAASQPDAVDKNEQKTRETRKTEDGRFAAEFLVGLTKPRRLDQKSTGPRLLHRTSGRPAARDLITMLSNGSRALRSIRRASLAANRAALKVGKSFDTIL